jgi:hypothetical protein
MTPAQRPVRDNSKIQGKGCPLDRHCPDPLRELFRVRGRFKIEGNGSRLDETRRAAATQAILIVSPRLTATHPIGVLYTYRTRGSRQ